MHPPILPTINASLNATAGVLLILGGIAIKNKKVQIHKRIMISAFLCSALFLCCYLYYHCTERGLSKYPGHGILKAIYLLVLIPHSILAALIVPFIIMAIRHALRGEIDKHTRITRKLYPAWLYVSVTGVIVYLMLYILPTG